MLARVFGISHVMDTLVGNEHIRGVSGGERKRVSIIETLATDSVVVAWDGSTRGLDAAATVDYARSLRILTDVSRKATVVSLYQVSEEVWDYMDKVLLLDEGRMLFQGPISEAKKYFIDLGYHCSDRRTTADFLTSITSPNERRFRPGMEAKAPKGAIELENAFRESPHYRALMHDMEDSTHPNDSTETLVNFQKSTAAHKSRYVSKHSHFTVSYPTQIAMCTKRQWWQLLGNKEAMWLRFFNTVVNAFLIGSLFYAQPATTEGAFSRGGFLFYTTVFLGWIQLAELEDCFNGREVVSRQKNFAFCRPSAVSFARVVLDIPLVFIQCVLFCLITYFLAGLQMTAAGFFTYFLFIYVITIALTALYRMFAAISPNYEVAIRYCGLSLLVYIIYGGYVMSLDRLMSDAPWFGWFAYLNPIYYGFEAVMATEFHNLPLRCSDSDIVPFGPSYNDLKYQTCAFAGSKPQSLTVMGDDYLLATFGMKYSNVWGNFGIVMAFTIALIFASAIFGEMFSWGEVVSTATVFNHKLKNARPDEEGGAVELQDHKSQQVQTGKKTNLVRSEATLTWKAMNYTIPTADGERVLLNSVDGICAPGEMTALVGSSGAGKTTLLTTLSQRQKIGVVSGDLFINGNALPSDFRRNAGFCEQMDVHDESATIREALEFSALLRQDRGVPREEKLAYVDTVLDLLNLTHLQHALIHSLALEQKKRTTIGVELCAKPKLLLFLDEPTSGLDSQGAYNIVLLLRRLSDEGQAIICTIHQASQQIIELFDNVLALNHGGNTFYCGPVGAQGTELIRYFRSHGIQVNDTKNVADMLIEVGTGVTKSTEGEKDWNEIWRNSPERQNLLTRIDGACANRNPAAAATSSDKDTGSEFAASTWDQCRHLTVRITRQYWRTPEYPYSRLYASFVHALLNGFTFFQLGNTAADLQYRAFTAFVALMLVPEFVGAVALRFHMNKQLWETREYPSRIYGSFAFSTAQIIPEIPFAILGSIIYYLLFYFPIGFPSGEPAGYTFLMMILFHLYATSWGQWITALTPTYPITANIIPFFIIMCETFNGILRPYSQIPVFWRYTMYYLNPFTYWIGGVLSATMTGFKIQCEQAELSRFLKPAAVTCRGYVEEWLTEAGGYVVELPGGEECGYCKYEDADKYLRGINVEPGTQWSRLGIFSVFVVMNMVLVYIIMAVKARWVYKR